MPPRNKFSRTNERFDIKHLVSDFNKSGLKDLEVHKLGCTEKRLIVTFNVRDFKPFATKSVESGIIAISPNLSNDTIDTKLLSLLQRSRKKQLYGKINYITGES